MADKKLPKRSEIDPRYTWKLEHIFPNAAAWEQAYARAEEAVEAMRAWSGRTAENPKQIIREYFSLQEQLNTVIEYALLARECDNGDPQNQAQAARAMALAVKAEEAVSFLQPELLALPDETLDALCKDPGMRDYDSWLRTLRLQKPHTLSKEQEQLLASLGDLFMAPNNTYSMLSNVDMKMPDMVMPDGSAQPLTDGTFGMYRESQDREIRRQSFEKVFGTYGSFGSTIASTYSASVKADIATAIARRYPDALAAVMQPLEIPRQVYDNLISVMHESLPILQDYLKLRKRALGLDELHMYDLYNSIVPDFDMPMPYEAAFDLVLEGLKPLGEDYLDHLREARTGGWIDVYPTENKSSGAFSAGSLAKVHPYVLLNHNDTLDSAFTIAHELGHSMHSYYSNHAQPFPKADYSLFVAEVASTCNEAIMMRFLLKKYADNPKARAYLLNHFLEQFRTTCMRQTMFAEFELKVHDMAQRGEPLTRETLSAVYYDLNKLYYGETCVVDEMIANEWMRIPHFYNAFYVYVYATGLCAAVSLSERILREGESAVKDYRRFLSAGSSVPPIEALKLAGIDMASPEPLRVAMRVFRDTLSEMEQLMDQLA